MQLYLMQSYFWRFRKNYNKQLILYIRMGDWESIFKTKGKFFHKPHEDMRKLAQLMKQNKVKTVLDLGCGSGRHIVFLAKQGFEVYGMDSSKSGLKQTREWLKQ